MSVNSVTFFLIVSISNAMFLYNYLLCPDAQDTGNLHGF